MIAAQKLCQSHILSEKELGVNILGQLGIPQRTFPEECLYILLQLLNTETNSQILSSIGIALGHLKDPRTVKLLVKFKNHPHEDVRYGVVSGISGHETPLAIDALVELTADNDADVRNWATFGLGTLIDTDTTRIREALWQRLIEEDIDTNENYEIYGEALVGLARRKDQRIIPILRKELESDQVSVLAVEAAAEIGDIRLYPALMLLKEWWSLNQDALSEAIKSCQRISL
ncbi:HEAT repeat domain-containing protein [Pleurocapsa sp. FMAR1]|uniref:HEAT repeat domain-containing protein n=1 Tax=Pleurocapsa sp. FMAR1 TaxID=3040204 RepID=UPI0029C605C6|nr:HEAT repeat domain-containing protein [Pleurocapsa sp. FMAR1]